MVVVDGQSGNPASTEVAFQDETFRVAGVPLIDVYLWWHGEDLIVVGFDCPTFDPESLSGETATDCGAMSQTVLRVEFADRRVSVVAKAVPVDEVPPGPLLGKTLLLDGGDRVVDLDDGTVSSGERLSAGTICGSRGGLVEIVPTSDDEPGAMDPTVRVRRSLDDAGEEITAGLPWDAGRLGGVAGCTTDGVAVFATSGGEQGVYELVLHDDGLASTKVAGPGMAPDSAIRVARDQKTLVATSPGPVVRSGQRQVWVDDEWMDLPDAGPANPAIVTLTTAKVVVVSGDQTKATATEITR